MLPVDLAILLVVLSERIECGCTVNNFVSSQLMSVKRNLKSKWSESDVVTCWVLFLFFYHYFHTHQR